MTQEVRRNEALRVFTFILVLLTVVGGPITFFLRTEYAIAFQVWARGAYKKVKSLYEHLTPDQKKYLFTLATRYKDKSVDYVYSELTKKGISEDDAKKIIKFGSGIIKQTLSKFEEKLEKK